MAIRQCLPATAAAALLLLGAKALAQTCSPGLYVAVAAPRDGEVNVPSNARVNIRVAGNPIPSLIENEFGLRQPPTGAPIPVFAARVAQSASYIVGIRLVPAQGFLNPGLWDVTRNVSGTTVTLSSFTVINFFDTTTPLPLTGASATVDPFDLHPDGGSDCIRDRVRRVRLTVPDAGKPVLYSIQENGQIVTSDDPSLVGIFFCTGQPQWQGDVSWVIAPGQHTIQLSAVDRVGHLSPSVDVSFNADCAATSSDGGIPGQGGVGPNGGGRPAEPTSGCSCQNGTAAALALGALGLILRARRKSSNG